MGTIVSFRKTANGSSLRLVKNGEKKKPARKFAWKKSQKGFREQVMALLTDEDKSYLVFLAQKRVKDFANDEYNYCRTSRGLVDLDRPEELVGDIADELEMTLFDRLLFSGRITEEDYDDALYVHESPLDGHWVFKALSGCELRIWRNEDAARRFVENDIEHDPAYYGYDDDVEIEDIGSNHTRFCIPSEDVLRALGKDPSDLRSVEEAVLLAEKQLSEKEKRIFIDYCDKEGRSVKADNVSFWDEDSFCMFLRDAAIDLECKASLKFFSLLDAKLGRENGKRARKAFKDLFALALYYKLTGHPVPFGETRIGNMIIPEKN